MKYLTILLFSAGTLFAQNDTIYLKNGTKYAVEITKSTNSQVEFTVNGQKKKMNLDALDRIYECDLEVKVDDFTGEKIASTKGKNIGKTKMGLYIRSHIGQVDESLFFYINTYLDLGCITSDSKVLIKFVDGEVLTFHNIGDVDCTNVSFACIFADGDLEQYSNKEFASEVIMKNREKFNTTPIDKIRLSGSDSYLDFDVSDKYFMMNALSCLEKAF